MPLQPISSKTEYFVSDHELRKLIAAHIDVPLEELDITFVQSGPDPMIDRLGGGSFGSQQMRTEAKVVHDHLKKAQKATPGSSGTTRIVR